MNIETSLQAMVKAAVAELYQLEAADAQLQIQKTKKEFEGDLTVVTFPFVKAARKAPEVIGDEIGNFLLAQHSLVSAFNVIKGFLNLTINTAYWMEVLNVLAADEQFGHNTSGKDKLMMIEYSSPNTNKPLHLGHVRNNLLGFSIAEIQKANG
ncbi:MAG: arginine--tRNA ligase, partial [Paludibacter sp.]|nr:arginine--tRNA ligase [Paludibacter sp.]